MLSGFLLDIFSAANRGLVSKTTAATLMRAILQPDGQDHCAISQTERNQLADQPIETINAVN